MLVHSKTNYYHLTASSHDSERDGHRLVFPQSDSVHVQRLVEDDQLEMGQVWIDGVQRNQTPNPKVILESRDPPTVFLTHVDEALRDLLRRGFNEPD